MATTTTGNHSPVSHDPLDKEKIERVETHEDHHEKDIHQINTLGVDPHNPDAEKGDDSDGKVNWTWKQVVATLCLCGLYVGEFTRQPPGLSMIKLTVRRFANPIVLRRRLPRLYWGKYRRC